MHFEGGISICVGSVLVWDRGYILHIQQLQGMWWVAGDADILTKPQPFTFICVWLLIAIAIAFHPQSLSLRVMLALPCTPSLLVVFAKSLQPFTDHI